MDLWQIVLPILAAQVIQTIVIAQVNKVRIESIVEDVREVKETAGEAHRRIDRIMRVNHG